VPSKNKILQLMYKFQPPTPSLSAQTLYTPRRVMIVKIVSTLSQKSATVAENGETTATVAEFGDSRTFLRQCGHAL